MQFFKLLKMNFVVGVLLAFVLFQIGIINSFAQSSSSTNFAVQNPVIDSGLGLSTSSNFGLGASLSQVAPGKSVSSNFQLLSGFQYFYYASPNTLSATAGDSQVSLSWTIPQVFLGAVIAGYELGVGTASGVYTYENVGNVTSFTKSGLSNGVTYYFKVRAKTASGSVLTSSNEVSSVPTPSTTSTTPGSSGGGGFVQSGVLRLSGFSAPNSKVVVLQNGSEIISGASEANGKFNLTLNNLGAGVYNLAIFYFDPDGVRSDFVNIRATVAEQKTVISSDIFLPPTLKADKSEVRLGDSIKFYGYAYPASSVLLYTLTDNPLTFQAGRDGKYEFNYLTVGLSKGFYSAKVKGVVGNTSSGFSGTLKFLVGTENILAPHIGSCPAKADFNKDCRVNLIDFSILAYWFERTGFPEEIDLNKDKVVDLIDFSILAYFWTD